MDFDEAEIVVRDFINAMNEGDDSGANDCCDPEYGPSASSMRGFIQFPIRLVSVNEKSVETYNGDKLAVFVFKIETTENGATETSSMDFKLRARARPPDWDFDSPRVRMYAPAQLIQSRNQWSDQFIKVTANPAKGKGGTCFGDSGGPVLQGSSDTIIGLTSWGTNYPCSGVSYAQRVDLADILAWIEGYLH